MPPSKTELESVAIVVKEVMFATLGYHPSMQICREFAGRMFAEARQKGDEIIVLSLEQGRGQHGQKD